MISKIFASLLVHSLVVGHFIDLLIVLLIVLQQCSLSYYESYYETYYESYYERITMTRILEFIPVPGSSISHASYLVVADIPVLCGRYLRSASRFRRPTKKGSKR